MQQDHELSLVGFILLSQTNSTYFQDRSKWLCSWSVWSLLRSGHKHIAFWRRKGAVVCKSNPEVSEFGLGLHSYVYWNISSILRTTRHSIDQFWLVHCIGLGPTKSHLSSRYKSQGKHLFRNSNVVYIVFAFVEGLSICRSSCANT